MSDDNYDCQNGDDDCDDFVDEDDDYHYEDDEDIDDTVVYTSVPMVTPFSYFIANLPGRDDVCRQFIFKTVEQICKRGSIDLDWSLDDDTKFYRPIISFTPIYAELHSHSLQVCFEKNDVTEKPFRIRPLSSMQPVALFSIIFHPFLRKDWNPFRDWGNVFELMNQVLQHVEPHDPIVGGLMSIDEAENVLPENIALEALIIRWYRQCGDAIKFDTWSSVGNVFEDQAAQSDIARLTRLKPQYVPYQGVGYGASRTLDNVTKTLNPLVTIISTINDSINQPEHKDKVEMIRWLAGSPLLTLILTSLQEYSGCFLPAESNHWFPLFSLLSCYEYWAIKYPEIVTLPTKVITELYTQFCQFVEYDEEVVAATTTTTMDIAEDDTLEATAEMSEANPSIAETTTTSTATKAKREYSSSSSISGKKSSTIVASVIKNSALCTMLWNQLLSTRNTLRMDHITTATSATEAAVAVAAVEEEQEEAMLWQKDKRVYLGVPSMLKNHYFKSKLHSSSSSSSSSAVVNAGSLSARAKSHLMRELNFLKKELLPQITLFVSEENLQLMVFTIVVDETPDNPYYGGVYVFHMFIPDHYPNVNPAVQFMTTNGGRVRFNPNLYHCGKVCLSLLGTWQGPAWDPDKSSLNQLLTSIYFLIFTEEPFFNEPGYETDRPKYAPQSHDYSLAVRGNVLTAAVHYHTRYACPILRPWLLSYLRQSHWPKFRQWFLDNAETYTLSRSTLAQLEEYFGAHLAMTTTTISDDSSCYNNNNNNSNNDTVVSKTPSPHPPPPPPPPPLPLLPSLLTTALSMFSTHTTTTSNARNTASNSASHSNQKSVSTGDDDDEITLPLAADASPIIQPP